VAEVDDPLHLQAWRGSFATAARPGSCWEIDASARRRLGETTYREVMCADFDEPPGPSSDAGLLDFVFADIWNRPGLPRRDRRWITLACVGASHDERAISAHVYAALKSVDMTLEEMQEFVLHFAILCGWPKAGLVDRIVHAEAERVAGESGRSAPPPGRAAPWRPDLTLEERLSGGAASHARLTCKPASDGTSAFTQTGILHFAFGEVWQRGVLSVRDRRLITLACVGGEDTLVPIHSHVYAALKSGDLSLDELREAILHFAMYAGWPKASYLDTYASRVWAALQADPSAPPPP
jgi:4-carboxymuconolactone decarboxylase